MTIYIEFDFLEYLVNSIFLIKFFGFLGKLAYLLFICNRKLLFFELDSLLLVCTTWTQNNTNIVKENYNLQKKNIYPIFPHYYHIY
jgi:hypothetical protein